MRKFICVVLCVSLAGCSFVPSYRRPSPPVPSQFPNAGQHVSATASEIKWKEFFKDPYLQKLIELALNNNRDYRVALLNVEQLRAQYRIVRYALLPSFELNASGLRQRDLGGSDNYVTSNKYQAHVNTAYEVDFFGRIRSLKSRILEQYLATQEASRTAQIALVAEVGVQYLTVRAMEEQLKLLGQTLKSIESYYELIDKSYQFGNASALDLNLAQAQVQTARAAMANFERQHARAHDALVLLIGQPVLPDFSDSKLLTDQEVIEDLPVGLSSDLIERRPDILAAEHQLKAANANIGAVRASFFPSITLTAADGTASAQLSKLFTPGTHVWSFSPEINLPLFNRDTNRANLDAAHVGKQIEIAKYEKTIQTAFKEVADALAGRDSLKKQIKAQQGLVDAQQERYRLAGARYESGVDNYLNVLLAQQDLYSAQENMIQVTLERLTNLISLYKALGGGWK